jgi:preprotein translocase subunit SecE
MEGLSRWVNLGFVFATLITWWVFGHLFESIFALKFIEHTNRHFLGENLTEASLYGLLLAVAFILVLWRNSNIYNSGLYIAQELKKVTWPSWADTKSSTKTVIIVSVIVACILATFDFTFQRITGMILGVS